MTDPGPSTDEGAELERLRRRVAELEAASAAGAGEPAERRRPPRRLWRTSVAVVLIVIASILAPLAVVAIWGDKTVTDTDRYVETIAPLVDDPAVQNALAARITAEIFTYVDVRAVTKQTVAAIAAQGLPPAIAAQLNALTLPIVSGVQGFVGSQVDKVVRSDTFAAAWLQVNRVAHEELVKALTGQGGGTVTVDNGTVSINLGPLIQIAKQQLTDAGFGLADRIPVVNTQFILFRSSDLSNVQSGFRLLNVLGVWLPIVTLVILAIGILVARNRRRAFIAAGLGVAAGMLVLGIALAVFRQVYLNSVPPDVLPNDAAAALYDTLVRFMRASLRRTAVAAIIVAVAAYLTGPGAAAVVTRRVLGSGIGALRRSAESAGLRTGKAGSWIHSYRGPLQVAAVTIAGIALILWNEPSIQVILSITVITLLVLGLIEFLARPPGPYPPRRPTAATDLQSPSTVDESRLVPADAAL